VTAVLGGHGVLLSARAKAREVRRYAAGGLGELVERLPKERAVGVVLRRVVNVRDRLVEDLRDVVEELRARALDLAPLLLVLRLLLRGLFGVRDGEQAALGGPYENVRALVEFLVVAHELYLFRGQVLALLRVGRRAEKKEECR